MIRRHLTVRCVIELETTAHGLGPLDVVIDEAFHGRLVLPGIPEKFESVLAQEGQLFEPGAARLTGDRIHQRVVDQRRQMVEDGSVQVFSTNLVDHLQVCASRMASGWSSQCDVLDSMSEKRIVTGPDGGLVISGGMVSNDLDQTSSAMTSPILVAACR